MSIVRVGMSESKSFGDGYDAIFGKKKPAAGKKATEPAKKATAKKKGSGKKGKKA